MRGEAWRNARLAVIVTIKHVRSCIYRHMMCMPLPLLLSLTLAVLLVVAIVMAIYGPDSDKKEEAANNEVAADDEEEDQESDGSVKCAGRGSGGGSSGRVRDSAGRCARQFSPQRRVPVPSVVFEED